MKTTAVITAGGTGVRFGATRPKQFIPVLGKMLIEHTIDAFDQHPMITGIVVVLPEPEIAFFEQERKQKGFGKKIQAIVVGGSTRQYSVHAGILALKDNPDFVVVHDAARCLITSGEITDTIQKCINGWEGAICALPIRDTVKKVDGEKILTTQPRENLWGMQTPQVFKYELIKKAYDKAKADHFEATDDAQIAEHFGASVCVVQGKTTNIKITYPEDLVMAEMILHERHR
ncbi:MAG: 2-C-methyl-D-erythritol 4-phosphate cytidylyltransferase [Proteobacteria bacterium]|jgi:2-C-methyl-D-erythritol 4-phosphate cytidylyltransferase|nr:2-C-methyl-D-erythritol 4-phosphate cytidylyltransferase [Pseudomonadota bacterium]